MESMKTEDFLVAFFLVVFVVFLSLAIMSTLTGYATESSTLSNVTISKYLAITLSGNLTRGITFGSVSALPSTDVNATANNNSAGLSTMFINVSTDSNVVVDFCNKANGGLYDPSGPYTIALGNETYLNSSTASAAVPGPPTSSVLLTTSYVKSSAPTAQGNVTYFRFWLDVPASTSAGDYNNSVSFKGVETATSC